jgi:hypothetical protein
MLLPKRVGASIWNKGVVQSVRMVGHFYKELSFVGLSVVHVRALSDIQHLLTAILLSEISVKKYFIS